MIIFTLRRLLLLFITIFFLSLIGFSLIYFTPHAIFVNISMIDAYTLYIHNLLHGDLGVSSINQQLIVDQIAERFPATMELCILAFILALFVGIPLGIIAGLLHGKWQDTVISTLALLGYSIPVFWLANLLILFSSLHLGLLPASGRYYLPYPMHHIIGFALIDAWLSEYPYRNEILINVILHMVLPVTTLALMPMSECISLLRISTDNVANQNYIKAASMRGLTLFTIIRRHVLHNALPPIIPKLGLHFSTMLTMAMVTEILFSWPGLAPWIINAIQQQDYAAISAGVILIGSLVSIVNVLFDIIGIITNPLRHK